MYVRRSGDRDGRVDGGEFLMKIKRPQLIMRVDKFPPTWYAGTNTFGEPTITKDRAYAWRFMNLDEARMVVEMLKSSVGGIWSIVPDTILQ